MNEHTADYDAALARVIEYLDARESRTLPHETEARDCIAGITGNIGGDTFKRVTLSVTDLRTVLARVTPPEKHSRTCPCPTCVYPPASTEGAA